jgi:hypothetical protein
MLRTTDAGIVKRMASMRYLRKANFVANKAMADTIIKEEINE